MTATAREVASQANLAAYSRDQKEEMNARGVLLSADFWRQGAEIRSPDGKKRGSRRALPHLLSYSSDNEENNVGRKDTEKKGGYRPYFGCLSPSLPTRLTFSTTSCLHCFELTRVCA